MTIVNFIHRYFFSIIVFLVLFLLCFLNYQRFLISRDYIVSYDASCNPESESCFVGCSDDECTEDFFYKKIRKYGPDLYKECGADISECDEANQCLLGDESCSITYCEVSTDYLRCSFDTTNN